MKSVKTLTFFLISLLVVGALSTANPAFAVTSAEITSISEGLGSDSGMIASATELAGADSDLVKEFQLGVKYGEFATRLYQGDYWGVAADFAKFQLGRAVDKLTDLASKKLLSAGARQLVGYFTALKDTGIWLGNNARNMQFSDGVIACYQAYKENEADRAFMEAYWTECSKGKLSGLADFDVWMDKFEKIYAIEKQAEKAPATTKDIVATEKVIKKTAIVHFFTLKYPGIGINVSEELADAIVNKAGSAAIKKIAEKYKDHLDGLTAKAESGVVSPSGICGVVKNKDDRKDCEGLLAKIVDLRNQVLSNRRDYPSLVYENKYRLQANYRWGIDDKNLTKFKKSQENIIASAYEFQFMSEIRAINSSFTAIKDRFPRLKSDYKNFPKQGDHWRMPSYKVSADKGFFTSVFKNGYNAIFQRNSYDLEDFKTEFAQKYYQKYLENELKANVADDIRISYLKAHLGKLNNLIRDFTILKNRINSLISSAESAWGVFSYGQTTIDGLKKMIAEIEELGKDVQSGEAAWWTWGKGAWSIDSVSETIKEMESDKKERKSSIVQLKKDYASAIEIYKEDEKQWKLGKQKQAEEEKKAAAEEKARALKKKTEEEDAVKQERARWEAEKQAAAEKARLEQQNRNKAFDTPLETNQKPTPSKSIPTTKTAKPATTRTKPTPPSARPSAQKKSTLPSARPSAQKKSTLPSARPSAQKKSTVTSGYAYTPQYYTEEIAGFSFIAQWKVDMTRADFYWQGDGIYTSGALDLGVKSLKDSHLSTGSKSLNNITSVPTSGYQEDPFQPEVGHVYAIKTSSGSYGIIQITLIDTNRLYFYWRYQPNGSTSFSP